MVYFKLYSSQYMQCQDSYQHIIMIALEDPYPAVLAISNENSVCVCVCACVHVHTCVRACACVRGYVCVWTQTIHCITYWAMFFIA